jgi:hypothetical protein
MGDHNTMTWLLIIIVLIAMTSIACLSFRTSGTSSQSVAVTSFTPRPDNDKVILVKGWNETEIRKIISSFNEQYKDAGYPAFTIEPHKESENLYRVTFPNDIHPLLFAYLINLLVYPFDIDLKDRSIVVAGKTTLDPTFDGVESPLFGTQAVLYVPENDVGHDVVYMQTDSGISLANSFHEGRWKRVNASRQSSAVKTLMGGN